MKKHLALALMLVATATNALAQPKPSAPTPAAPTPAAPSQPTPAGPKATPPAPTPAPQPGPGDDAKKAEAKALYEKGLSHYNLGEFDLAIKAFREAYAISSKPGLLFNIAQSFRLKKDYEQATYFYQTYLRLQPDAANRVDVEARIKEMQEAMEEAKKQAEKKPIGTIPPDGNAAVTTTTTTTTTTQKPFGPEKPTEPTGVKAQTLLTAGYATAGAGAALVITGVVFGSMARSAEKDLNKLSADHGTWGPAEQDKYDAGKRNNTIAMVSFIAGGAALATGATLFVLGTMKKSKTRVAITPTPNGTTFAVGWSF
jgi:tetratricopeptide (TPR) repeat protein